MYNIEDGDYVKSVLLMIAAECKRVFPNGYTPFYGSMDKFTGDVFQIEAYSWDDNYDQPWNFKWRDYEVSWYKYFARSLGSNRVISDKEASIMLRECLESLL